MRHATRILACFGHPAARCLATCKLAALAHCRLHGWDTPGRLALGSANAGVIMLEHMSYGLVPRSKTEEFLELVRRSRQGRLKVFLGPAAGVGKTYRMLQEAHQLRERGVDVVLGVIDAHGRAETLGLSQGLPQVPLRKLVFRDIELLELDVD